jgi:hypothetical protein
MNRILVTEGKYDAIMLRTLLSAVDLADVQILEGGGKSSAISLGTSLALNRRMRVAIVVDADTTYPNRLEEQREIFEDLQRRGAGDGSCKLFLAVPTLEDDLFPTAEAFASTFGLKLTPRQVDRYSQGWQLVARAFLSKPEADKMTTIAAAVRPAEVSRLFDKPLLRDLKTYLSAADEQSGER